ncbi:hypothetical protein KQX54_017052 [Cotesia glomerata]|uniref:Uncharacterized protein n=1 Tax=Cotesia glomerata TaxID=32391 RepID=A0AAV7IA21_COTGL|nr:hypothetical protein KQX54_017052 [Cotesia glomerata]
MSNEGSSQSSNQSEKRPLSDYADELPQANRKRKVDVMTEVLVAVLDHTKTSNQSAMHIISAVITSLGLDIDNYNISYTTIRNARLKFRKIAAGNLKDGIEETAQNLIVDWDELLPTGTVARYVYHHAPNTYVILQNRVVQSNPDCNALDSLTKTYRIATVAHSNGGMCGCRLGTEDRIHQYPLWEETCTGIFYSISASTPPGPVPSFPWRIRKRRYITNSCVYSGLKLSISDVGWMSSWFPRTSFRCLCACICYWVAMLKVRKVHRYLVIVTNMLSRR